MQTLKVKICKDLQHLKLFYKIKERNKSMPKPINDSEDKGYPKTFGYTMWFIIHDNLKQSIIQALMQNDKNIINKLLINKS